MHKIKDTQSCKKNMKCPRLPSHICSLGCVYLCALLIAGFMWAGGEALRVDGGETH